MRTITTYNLHQRQNPRTFVYNLSWNVSLKDFIWPTSADNFYFFSGFSTCLVALWLCTRKLNPNYEDNWRLKYDYILKSRMHFSNSVTNKDLREYRSRLLIPTCFSDLYIHVSQIKDVDLRIYYKTSCDLNYCIDYLSH